MPFKPVDPKQRFPQMETNVLKHWQTEKIFQKSIDNRKDQESYVFYDGPPYVTGSPHHGTLLSSVLKDVVPRFWTMKGKQVERRFGWDCHGLPIEHMVEKMLGLNGKKDIEEYGVDKFNEKCREIVSGDISDWVNQIDRIWRWVDFANDYKTMDATFMESQLWVFKELWKKGLVYKSDRISLFCTRCSTPIANSEVQMDNSYEDRSDPAVTVKFKVIDKDFSILAWTTTPWTLPSNLYLAVGAEIDYLLVKDSSNGEKYLLAKELINKYYKNEEDYQIEQKLKGAELEGLKYEPLFPYFANLEKGENKPFQILTADFVTTADGTGIVHIAPGFGEDDYNLVKSINGPVVCPVDIEGRFSTDITDFAGKKVLECNNDIIEKLKTEEKLIKKESITHSYPHCHRCSTPLIYKAQPARYVELQKAKTDLIANNEKINRYPDYIKHGRFQNILETTPDWSISRNRFWGCPMPVWECSNDHTCKHTECLGSIEDIFQKTNNKEQFTKIIFVRHGRTDYNDQGLADGLGKGRLTELGQKQAAQTAASLKDVTIDKIYASPFIRCQETIQYLADSKNLEINTIEDLKEINHWQAEGQKFNCWQIKWNDDKIGNDGETIKEVYHRLKTALNKILAENKGKTVAICSHGDPIILMIKALNDMEYSMVKAKYYIDNKTDDANLARVRYFDHQQQKEFDLHKHYLDEIEIACPKCNWTMKRTPEVLDVWFDSGAMPFGQTHYPFENKEWLEGGNFPCDFIAEYTPQTRGWFHKLHVLGTLIFNKPAFNNCICHGTILAKDGKKISKSKKNYTDPQILLNEYGADAFRLYLLQSGLSIGDNLRFNDDEIIDIVKKVLLPLWNSYSFFVTYANLDNIKVSDLQTTTKELSKLNNPLDQWIISVLQTLLQEVNTAMEEYQLTMATRKIFHFIDSLTNWYIRRSRRRFWKSESDQDKLQAYQTLYFVLTEVSKIMAPFAPFISEEIYRNLTDQESVHLENWSAANKQFINQQLEQEIQEVRDIISIGLGIRANQNIKVRQPLPQVKFNTTVKDEYLAVIKEELNVKEIALVDNVDNLAKIVVLPNAKILGPQYGKNVQFIIKNAKAGNFTNLDNGEIEVNIDQPDLKSVTLKSEEFEVRYEPKEDLTVEAKGNIVVALDTNITPELKKEGEVRDLVRIIQDLRKQADYNLDDRIKLQIEVVTGNFSLDDAGKKYLGNETLSTVTENLEQFDTENEVEIGDSKLNIKLKR